MEDSPDTTSAQRPETEVRPDTGRRRFTKAYKLRILAMYDECLEQGEKAALLRREGLYSGYITNWRRQLNRKATSKTGRPPLTPAQHDNKRLRAENERLKRELDRAKLAIDVQKKLLMLLESASQSSNEEPS